MLPAVLGQLSHHRDGTGVRRLLDMDWAARDGHDSLISETQFSPMTITWSQ